MTNYALYSGSGTSVTNPVNAFLQANADPGTIRRINSAWTRNTGTALAAVFGRLSQYSANFNYGLDGHALTTGTPVQRDWATEEYDVYAQDIWKFRRNITVTLGLRYGLSRPVYETGGFQAVPNIPLDEYFKRRVQAANIGINYTDPLTIELGGPANQAKGFSGLDTNNFQPRAAVAWSPDFKSGWLSKVFGKNQNSVIRAGFAITNDHFGEQLAVSFDANNQLGFSSTRDISANTYNVTTNPARLYTGPGMSIRTLPNIIDPGNLIFPEQQPLDDQRRIEASLDSNLVSPVNYSWNLSYGRKLPLKMYIDVSYIGRLARNLLATRDVMQTNNIRDVMSGQTWYEAATAVELQRRAGALRGQIQAQPFFEHVYAPRSIDFFGLGGSNTQNVFDLFDQGIAGGTDWTFVQDLLDGNSGNQLYFQRQYGALSSFGTIASSDYHAMTISIRQRAKGLTWDLNYTFSKSMDDASGLQTSTSFGSAFILNALRQQDSRSVSDFDLTHIINFNSVWDVPIGKNRQFFGGMNSALNTILGGWQLTSIARYNTGAPIGGFADVAGWATNWQITSSGASVRPIRTSQNSTTGTGGVPNLFSNPQAAYNSFRSPLPGESGDRNQLRYPSYYSLDAGLAKSFSIPKFENSRLTFRWDVFNVTNTARFTGIADNTLGYMPDATNVGPTFGNFTSQQGSPRVMQFALRLDF